jgi:L-asparaginase
MTKKIVVLAMGGTIAGTAADPSDNVAYKAADVGVDELFSSIPGIDERLQGYELVTEQVAQIDSKDLSFDECRLLLQRVCHHLASDGIAGVVITHGTDTLEETAFFLDQVLPSELIGSKCVVMTCAMRPSTSQFSDGPLNILDALTVATSVGVRGLLVVCAGKVFAGAQIQKVHPYRLDAFDSGETSPLGFLEESRLRNVNEWPSAYQGAKQFEFMLTDELTWPRVEIVFSYANADGFAIEAICRNQGLEPPLAGIVVAGTGNGTIHQKLESALSNAVRHGVRVVRTTRCCEGSVVKQSQPSVQEIPIARTSNPFKARIALMLDLMAENRSLSS